ncbi:MAG: DUF5660 family protein [Candidatus Levyibacteriota bacterium]
MADKKTKKQKKQFINKNAVEALQDVGGGIATAVKNDVAKGMMTDLWDQFLGADKYKQSTKESGDLQEGEELNLSAKKDQKEEPAEKTLPGLDYQREILHGERRVIEENKQAIEVKIQEIIIEIKKLTAQSKELQAQFKEITVEILPVNPGQYHLNFFEWMILTIRQARMKVEDSASWLALFTSKKGKKEYWAMFKKHGTTFGLSNERVVATQTG